MFPSLICGGIYIDSRGELKFNNSFNMSQVKRFYSITLKEKLNIRRWQGHRVEQRWFTAVSGSFRIQLILVDNWNKPKVELNKINFDLSSEKLDVLHIPGGYLTSIEATSDNSTLLVMSDYSLNEIDDEYRFPEEYFKK
jgi:dTDP-4-dehydrorhamnose 3,5-epimerase-like enzyme